MRQIANQYTFSASGKRVVILGIWVPESRLESIVNSAKNQVIWQRGASMGAVSSSNGNTVVDLDFDTASHSDSDLLSIYYDDGRSGEESLAISHIDKIGGSDPAEWLKKGGPRVPVEVDGAGAGVGMVVEKSTGVAPAVSGVVLPANANRKYLLIQNLSSAPLHINFSDAASASTLRIDAYGALVFESGVIPTNSIQMVRTAENQQYYIVHA